MSYFKVMWCQMIAQPMFEKGLRPNYKTLENSKVLLKKPKSKKNCI